MDPLVLELENRFRKKTESVKVQPRINGRHNGGNGSNIPKLQQDNFSNWKCREEEKGVKDIIKNLSHRSSIKRRTKVIT